MPVLQQTILCTLQFTKNSLFARDIYLYIALDIALGISTFSQLQKKLRVASFDTFLHFTDT
ncbi:TPA: hypothetical protein DEG75_02540 [Candidatus Dependentiae bacterium]|nr:hypothetical protein [Candidatus Dependentiae bacterium]